MIFAMDAESFRSENPTIREMGRRIFENATSLLFRIYAIVIIICPWVRKYWHVAIVPKDVEQFFTGLMRDAIEHRQRNNISRVDYMDHLLQVQKAKSLSNLEMAALSMTFFLDGFETSSIFVAHVLFQVSRKETLSF
jgi:cytochrome P450